MKTGRAFATTCMLALPLCGLLSVAACGDDDETVSGVGQAKVRVIHASYDAPPVDVSIDGAKAISALAYGKSSGYAGVAAGKRAVTVAPSAGGASVITAELTLEKDTDYTVFAVNALSAIGPVVATDARAPSVGKAKVRFVHAAPDAPAVDIKVGTPTASPVFGNAAFKSVAPYAAVDAGPYAFVVTAAGQSTAVISFKAVTLEAGKVYTVVALGTLAASDATPFVVRAFVDNDPGSASVDLQPADAVSPQKAKVMVIHASPDAPAVDLLVDGTKVNSAALAFPKNTGYLELEAGTRRLQVNAAGASTSVIDASPAFEANKAYSVFAANKLASIEPVVLTDDLTAPAAGKAHVRFVHLAPDAPAVDVAVAGSTTPVFANTAFKQSSAFIPVDAGTLTVEVKLNPMGTTVLTVPNVTLEAGKIYTVFAKGLVANSTLGAEIIVNK
ncbi:MAG: DUF4397 domain-containing protein [Proteobacteria bacterium]|nr:DUF4397 domain-containing protein [Pseudomonadota bacterium]